MYKLNTNLDKCKNELGDIIKMFVPYFLQETEITINLIKEENQLIIEINYDNDKKNYAFNLKKDGQEFDMGNIKNVLFFCKISLYKALSNHFKISLPWGSLTGIRPTKIIYKLLSQNKTLDEAIDIFEEKYLVSKEKSDLTRQIILNQEGLVYHNHNKINLYVHIPFCPTKCTYCSFVTLPSNKHHFLIESYLDCLIEEISRTKEIIKIKNQNILSVYIGGGTPTVLSAEQVDRLLKAIDINNVEYTVEAGRPDTVTKEKLSVLRQNGVNRICINPQTFVDSTLLNIGRSHTSSQIYPAFRQAEDLGFDINMDLIAGLPQETLKDFIYTLDCTIKLNPTNITLHSLSFKNGSGLVNDALNEKGEIINQRFNFNPLTSDMIQYGHTRLLKANYLPYYLYRQKNISGNQENIGYCLTNKQSVNNITVMEESVPVYACGAGAISKAIDKKQIKRHANLRDVLLYINEFKQRLTTKSEFLLNCNQDN